ncbi:SDR family NAD(P)-dependent oxidoreductase [Alicyclobacillus fastidiosus]|uniref:SDR family oxidoreductase n=1 Tax=Alicyclobacillus fastidiosus TaxID=392011 RepID=A0ABV5AJY5_9BACL|nr:SDR family oxidoreductase [Alicyclobacillus fastidiosus]WEH09044.1 SDR family NAD(P)-dependent oxidoreductase [Alicyclobacillus fastidiosus]
MPRAGFERKVAVVTGGSQGIGSAITQALLASGATVVCIDRVKPEVAEGAVHFAEADLYDSQAIEYVVEETVRQFDHIDILVNCAGIYPSKPAIAIDEAEWDAVLDLNLKAPFLLCRAVAKTMIQRHIPGSIVNIASTAAQSARPGVAHYASSKAGLVMLTRVLALEWAPYQIRVNAVCPGLVETDTLMKSLSTPTLMEEHREKAAKIPLGRAAKPGEIAEAVLNFVDPATSSYTTGQALFIDGGYTAGQTFATFKEQMDECLVQL